MADQHLCIGSAPFVGYCSLSSLDIGHAARSQLKGSMMQPKFGTGNRSSRLWLPCPSGSTRVETLCPCHRKSFEMTSTTTFGTLWRLVAQRGKGSMKAEVASFLLVPIGFAALLPLVAQQTFAHEGSSGDPVPELVPRV
eukprot:4807496-Amphidinium_carterae.2